ncbi:spermidine/putrescine ABC transporter ATP-binding protein [Bacillus mycoides]|nr:spermidine/putrescine ABC transporter ATP-binding protein [Bacillus mycoides]QEL83454.1 spermidine/putrescine ABC transporter ATP-binding protein [Bacillus mycoides]QWG99284.1 spermidine/putrescine ABC transporter ATP-binding protein [Bacillus mycoides]
MERNNRSISLFIPLFVGSKTPPQNSAGAKKLGGRSTACKRPIGEG